MAFPEFDIGKKKILLFSRGRGRCHAIQDMEIARELETLCPEVQVRFVSYSMGARTLEAHGVPHIDLGFSDRNPINETIVLAAKLIGWLDPDLVVAHEEFMALPAAKIFDKPEVLITDWFIEPDKYSMTTLRFADRILFLDEPGIYEEPDSVKGKVDYVGPVIRNFRYRCADRDRSRAELGVPTGSLAIAVLPGSWRESEAPILDLVLGAFDLLEHEPKHLIWAAGDDSDLIRKRTVGRDNVLVKDYDPEIERIMVTADVAITKANRGTHFELHHLGVPSISISGSLNPIDDYRAARFPNNEVLTNKATASQLASAVIKAGTHATIAGNYNGGTRTCAQRLLDL